MDRPGWPYVLAAVGAALFAVGAGMLYVAIESSHPGNTGAHGMLVIAIGSALLGVGWVGALKFGQGGFGAVSGSFAVTVALGYAYANRNDWGMFAASGTLILLAFVWFALGHLFARGMRIAKIPAGIALIGLTIEVVQTARKAHFDAKTEQMMWMIALGGLAVMGLACAVEVLGLRRAPTEPDDL